MISFRIKICGITNASDAVAAAAAGADAIGLNFYPKSLRWVSLDVAKSVGEALAESTKPLQKVGVFVNSTVLEVRRTADQLGLHSVQLHGDEACEIMRELSDVNVIRAIRIAKGDFMSAAEQIQKWVDVGCETFLLDAAAGASYGGTGNALEWSRLPEFCLAWAANRRPLQWILAGGLSPQNVAEAIRIVQPDAVDVASGVEGLPGKKDPHLVQQFVEEALRSWN